MTSLPFVKMQALGNDFVLIDGILHPQWLDVDQKNLHALAQRHYGIGCDQILLLKPSTAKDISAELSIFNPDGGEAGQCGNGMRCVALYLKKLRNTKENSITLKTSTTRVEIEIRNEKNISVNMGIPEFTPSGIPYTQTNETTPLYELKTSGKTLHFGLVNLGNPHAVIEVDSIFQAPVSDIAPLLQRHNAFPNSVNVGFMQIINPRKIKLRVYERGAGETLACGSGACAAVAVGRMQKKLAESCQVDLPGGSLSISWEGEGNPVWMKGSAKIVFTGEWLWV
jgi:diaminopimelate epimerase